jgi:hypothetical protein
MARNTLLYGKDVKSCFLVPAESSFFSSFFKKVVIDFCDVKYTSGKMVQTYGQPGYTKQTVSKYSFLQLKTVGNDATTGRGSLIVAIGDAGATFQLSGFLVGKFLNRRNKLVEKINEPNTVFKLYLPHDQTLNSARSITAINKNKSRTFYYVKILEKATIDYKATDIGGCTINLTCQEVPYKQQNNNKLETAPLWNTMSDILSDIQTYKDYLLTGFNSMNEALSSAILTMQDFGSDASDILIKIQNFNTKLSELLNSPNDLKLNINSIGNSMRNLFKNIVPNNNPSTRQKNQQSAYKATKELAFYKASITPQSNTIAIQGKLYYNVSILPQKIADGQTVFLTRLFGFLGLIEIINNYYFTSIEQAKELARTLEQSYSLLYKDQSYNGLTLYDTTVNLYTVNPKNYNYLFILESLYYQTQALLRDIRIVQANSSEEILSKDERIIDLMFRYYYAQINDNPTIYDILVKNFILVNNIYDPFIVLPAGTNVIIPDVLV